MFTLSCASVRWCTNLTAHNAHIFCLTLEIFIDLSTPLMLVVLLGQEVEFLFITLLRGHTGEDHRNTAHNSYSLHQFHVPQL